VFQDYVFVIDANFPWGAREILPEITKTTGKPIRYVFDTHYHSAHTFGNSVFVDAGAAIVCSQDCANELAAKGPGAMIAILMPAKPVKEPPVKRPPEKDPPPREPPRREPPNPEPPVQEPPRQPPAEKPPPGEPPIQEPQT